MGQTPECPSCGSLARPDAVYEQDRVPVHSCLLIGTREEAVRFPRGRLQLVLCRTCGFVWNLAFEPERLSYSASYEETQSFSGRFRRFQTGLVERLVDRYHLRGKRVLEIGCGKGGFLLELCERGGNWGVGFDPSYRSERTPERVSSRVQFRAELYTEQHAHVTADFVCCRHTLEHIPDTGRFLRMVRRALAGRDDVVLFFEVPDVERVFLEGAFWDLYYEHCSYFSAGSLGRLFRSTGFEILELYHDYDGQYLLIEALPSDSGGYRLHPAEEPVERLEALVPGFRRSLPSTLGAWRRQLERLRAHGQVAALWGSGSKAVAFLTALEVGNEITQVVDINPNKHGKFLAGTGHPIVPPESLRELRPSAVVVMNPIYREEISGKLEAMGVQTEVICL